MTTHNQTAEQEARELISRLHNDLNYLDSIKELTTLITKSHERDVLEVWLKLNTATGNEHKKYDLATMLQNIIRQRNYFREQTVKTITKLESYKQKAEAITISRWM